MSETALVKSNGGALSMYEPDAITATMTMAKALVASRLTPRGLDTPEKAFYVIMKGRELGVPPIRSLERIHIIEGKCCMAAELMLERFRGRGGKSKWLDDKADRTRAELWIRCPNGDEHTEVFTMEDAKAAGLAGKDNWRKWPKSMLRARAIAQGLRAMGEAEGLYDPDELGAVTNDNGEVITLTPKAPGPRTAPFAESSGGPLASSTAPSGTDDEPEDEGPILTAEYTEPVPVFDPETGEQVREEPKITSAQLARIHIMKRECGHHLDDKKLRAWMMKSFGKDSSADLSTREANKVIEMLDRKLKKLAKTMETRTELFAQDLKDAHAEDMEAIRKQQEPGEE